MLLFESTNTASLGIVCLTTRRWWQTYILWSIHSEMVQGNLFTRSCVFRYPCTQTTLLAATTCRMGPHEPMAFQMLPRYVKLLSAFAGIRAHMRVHLFFRFLTTVFERNRFSLPSTSPRLESGEFRITVGCWMFSSGFKPPASSDIHRDMVCKLSQQNGTVNRRYSQLGPDFLPLMKSRNIPLCFVSFTRVTVHREDRPSLHSSCMEPLTPDRLHIHPPAEVCWGPRTTNYKTMWFEDAEYQSTRVFDISAPAH